MADRPRTGKVLGGLRRNAPILAVLTLIFAAGAAYALAIHVPRRRAALLRQLATDLDARAVVRADAVGLWVGDALQDAATLASIPEVRALFPAEESSEAGRRADEVIALVARLQRLDRVLVAGKGERVRASSSGDTVVRCEARAVAAATLASGTSQTILHLHPDGRAMLGVTMPIGADSARGRAVAAVLVEKDPGAWLYPFLGTNLGRHGTAEAVLVQYRSDTVVWLTPLRKTGEAPLARRVARADVGGMPAAAPTTGRQGLGAYRDYAGSPVYAVARPVAGTDWDLVLKVDQAEVLAPFRGQMARDLWQWALLYLASAALALVGFRELRRRQRAAMERGQAQFAALLDQANDPMWALSPEGRVLHANRRAEEFYGTEPGALKGQDVREFQAPGHVAEAEAQLGAAQSETGVLFETVHRARGGEHIPVEVSARRVALPDGDQIVAVVRDIRERRAAESRIRQLNRLLRTLSEINQLMVHGTDPRRVLEEACQVVVEQGGFALAWIGVPRADGSVEIASAAGATAYLAEVGVRWDESPEGRGPAGTALRERRTVAVTDADADERFRPWREAARRHNIGSCAAVPIRAGEDLAAVLAVFADRQAVFDPEMLAVLEELAGDLGFALKAIQERQALWTAEAERTRLTAALEQAAEAVIITDVDGTIRYVNPAFERVTGYARAEAVGRNPRILKSGVQGAETYRALWATLTAGEVYTGTLINRKKDGEHYVAEVVISPVRDPSGAVVEYVGLQRDATRERELEDQLRQAQKMEALGHLTGGVAHDFNNLLNIVLTNVALARDELPAGAAEASTYLGDIEQAALSGSGMVHKLLAFGRREQLRLAPLELGRAVGEIERTLRRILPESIHLGVVSAGRDLPIAADEGALEQMVINLATNARDAMPRGGTLSLALGVATVRADDELARSGTGRPGRYATLGVSDSGTGMDEATMAHAFEPFFTTKPPGSGTGLGLSMVFGLVKQHGGFVRIASESGRGTTVRLHFPLRTDTTPEAPAERRTEPLPAGHETILVVEDQEMLRRAAARALAKLGYEVLVAADGLEGLRILDEQGDRIALVLSDQVMPNLGGVELYERIRAERRPVRFLLMSGYATSPGGSTPPEELRVLAKPWTIDALARAVREVLAAPPRRA